MGFGRSIAKVEVTRKKWVLKVIYKANGSIEIYKTCIEVKEHTPQKGVDLEEFLFSNSIVYLNSPYSSHNSIYGLGTLPY